jgi:hypothetical protein
MKVDFDEKELIKGEINPKFAQVPGVVVAWRLAPNITLKTAHPTPDAPRLFAQLTGSTPTNPSTPKSIPDDVQHTTLGADPERTILKGFIATGKADAVQKLGLLLQLPEIKTMLGTRKGQLALVVDLAGYEDIRKEIVRLAREKGWIAT